MGKENTESLVVEVDVKEFARRLVLEFEEELPNIIDPYIEKKVQELLADNS